MKKLILTILMLGGSDAIAGDAWLCTEESSVRRGNSIMACGVATHSNEAIARLHAFDAAKVEFNRVCGNSANCRDQEVSVEPKRTSCDLTDKGYKCYRLIAFELSEVKETKLKEGMSAKTLADIIGQKPYAVTKLKDYADDSYFYSVGFTGDVCSMGFCYATVKNGKVINLNGFKPEYMGF